MIDNGSLKIITGLILGIVFGIIVVKSSKMLRPSMKKSIKLSDFSFIQLIMFSIAIGAILFYVGNNYGLFQLSNLPNTNFWGVLLGSLVTGLGFAICGQYFISSLVGFVTGKIYSIWVLLGMLLALPFHRFLKGLFNSSSELIATNSTFEEYISIHYLPLWISVLLIIGVLIMQINSKNNN